MVRMYFLTFSYQSYFDVEVIFDKRFRRSNLIKSMSLLDLEMPASSTLWATATVYSGFSS